MTVVEHVNKVSPNQTPDIPMDDTNIVTASTSSTSALPQQTTQDQKMAMDSGPGIPFPLDENTLKTLQQIMESHGLHTTQSSTQVIQLKSFCPNTFRLPPL